MGLLNILGRLDLNGAGFQATLKNAEKQADKFSAGLTKKLVGVGTGWMGFNALKAMGLAAIDNAAEITKLGKAFDLSTDQVQLLQAEAERTGKPFQDLVKDAEQLKETLSRLQGGEVIFSAQTVQNLTNAGQAIKAFKDAVGERVGDVLGGIMGTAGGVALTPAQQAFAEILAERKREEEREKQAAEKRLKEQEDIKKVIQEAKEIEEKTVDEGLTKAERLNKLLEKRAQMVDEIARIPFEPGSMGEAQDRLRVARLDAQIAGLRGDTATTRTASKTFSPISDSLTSVGNFLGANPNAETRNQLTEANRTLKSMDRKLSELKTSGGAFPL